MLGVLCLFWGKMSAQSFGITTDPGQLESRLKTAANDTQRVDILNDLSESWRPRNTDSAFAFARQAYDLARKVDYQRGTGDARLNQAYAFLKSGRPADANATIAKARVDFQQRNDGVGLGKCALAEAAVMFADADQFNALLTCLSADSLFRSGKDTLGQIRVRYLRSEIFSSLRLFPQAIAEMDQAQALAGEGESAAAILSRKGRLQAMSGDPVQAIANFAAALKLVRQMSLPREEVDLLLQQAKGFRTLNDSANGLEKLISARALAEKHQLEAGQAHAFREMAQLTLPIDSARNLMQKAMAILPDSAGPLTKAVFHRDFARVWMRWPDYDLALARTDSALKWLDSVPDMELQAEVEMIRYRIFDRIGNTGRAFRSFEKANELKESHRKKLAMVEKAGEALAGRYSLMQRASEQEKLISEAVENNQKKAQEREMIILIGTGVLAFLTLLFLVMFLRSRGKGRSRQRMVKRLQGELEQADEEILVLDQKLNLARDEVFQRGSQAMAPDPEKIEEVVAARTRELNATVERLRALNGELDTFMYRASHDLLGPIARLKGLVQVARSSDDDVASLQSYVDLIGAVSVYMDRVLRKLIIVHELNHVNRQISLVNIGKTIEEITPRLSELPGISQPFILLHDELEGKVKVDEHLLGIVLENLLENACIFRSDPDNSRPRIDVWMRRKGRDIEIELRDDGIGIPDLIQAKVFEIFFRGSERSKGNGLGLYLVKMAMDLLGGRMEMESEEGVFTLVRIRFPEGK
jgi:signal transduction histidine kinase